MSETEKNQQVKKALREKLKKASRRFQNKQLRELEDAVCRKAQLDPYGYVVRRNENQGAIGSFVDEQRIGMLNKNDGALDLFLQIGFGKYKSYIRGKSNGCSFKCFQAKESFDAQKCFHYVLTLLESAGVTVYSQVVLTNYGHMNRELSLGGSKCIGLRDDVEEEKLIEAVAVDMLDMYALLKKLGAWNQDAYDKFSPMESVYKCWCQTVSDEQERLAILCTLADTEVTDALSDVSDSRIWFETLYKKKEDDEKEGFIKLLYQQGDGSRVSEFIKEEKNNVSMKKLHNRILFGAPGTGKSYQLKEDEKSSCLPEDQVERVTFHPEYSYFDFVGAYKPKMKNDRIVYDFVPGPFARTLKKALLNKDKTYLLIIEEINRARVAAVFGDMFQLLDRDETGASEYSINPSEELKDFLVKEGLRPEDIDKIRIPGNMYIWATMNSADQGVYPMDTAFKRRWNFEYTGIDEGERNVKGEFAADWKVLRKHVNELLQKAGINEDKQMGPFFLKKSELQDKDSFVAAVKNKVLMYLFEDAAKHKRTVIFNLKSEEMRYSTICEKFVSKYKDEEPAKSTEAPEASEKMKMALEALFKPVASAKVESKSGASPNSTEGEPTNAE